MKSTVDAPDRPVNGAVSFDMARAYALRIACVAVSVACLRVIVGPSTESSAFPAYQISATAKDHHWSFHHAGPDLMLGTGDDRMERDELRLPAHRQVSLRLASEDYLYAFALPVSGGRGLAVPEIPQRLQIVTGGPAQGVIEASELCGVPDARKAAAVRVMDASRYDAWLREGD